MFEGNRRLRLLPTVYPAWPSFLCLAVVSLACTASSPVIPSPPLAIFSSTAPRFSLITFLSLILACEIRSSPPSRFARVVTRLPFLLTL